MVFRYILAHPANRGRALPATLFRAIKFQVRGRLLHRPTLVPLGQSSKVWARVAVANAAKAAYGNPPDPECVDVWRAHLQPGDLFVDVGANVGNYTIIACELGATVIAVEPDPLAVDRLRENLIVNGYKAEVLEAALAATPGTANITADLDSRNYIVTEAVADEAAQSMAARAVATSTLDTVLGTKAYGAVKIDVEGAELEVLNGATQALRDRRVKLLQLEWNNLARRRYGYERSDIGKLLNSYGYDLFIAGPNGKLLPYHEGDSADDVFAVPQTSMPWE